MFGTFRSVEEYVRDTRLERGAPLLSVGACTLPFSRDICGCVIVSHNLYLERRVIGCVGKFRITADNASFFQASQGETWCLRFDTDDRIFKEWSHDLVRKQRRYDPERTDQKMRWWESGW